MLIFLASCSTQVEIQSQNTPSAQIKVSSHNSLSSPHKEWFDSCSEYEVGTDAFGFCLYKESETMNSISDLKEYCSWAGGWESQCIYNWVATKIAPNSGYSTVDLLELCGNIKDCAFRVVDYRPTQDVLDQLNLCKRYVRRNFDDCAMHAMLNWWKKNPSEEEVLRLMKAESEISRHLGYYLTVRIYCDGVGECKGSKVMQTRCLELSKAFKKGEKQCPKIHLGDRGSYKIPGTPPNHNKNQPPHFKR
ncbi:MAG: hypothetical protein CMK59_10225 [Proteobacteria bacterium]|nr:hypothetical protein [Pseudomonadota bacterium]